MDQEETPPILRLLLAVAIPLGVVLAGMTFIYSWMLLFPLLVVMLVAVAVRGYLRSRDAPP